MIDRVFETTGICIRPTTATYTGPTSGEYHDPITVSGTLFDARRGTPIASKTLTIGLGTESCTGRTDVDRHRHLLVHTPAGPRARIQRPPVLPATPRTRADKHPLMGGVHAQQGADPARQPPTRVLRQRGYRHGAGNAHGRRPHSSCRAVRHVHARVRAHRPDVHG